VEPDLSQRKGKSLLASNKQELKTAIFEDSACAVLRADPAKPHLLEVIATFHDAARARDYVRSGNNSSDKHQEKQPVIKQASAAKPKQASKAEPTPARPATQTKPKIASEAKPIQASAAKPRPATEAKPKLVSEAKPKTVATDMSERQSAVLKALRSMMDKKNLVEATKTELAKASSIPSGSLHSVLLSLEKKGMIRTERQGTPKFSAIYQVLETSKKSTRLVNGLAHSKEVVAKTLAH
jgi:uncharacterized membrane protein